LIDARDGTIVLEDWAERFGPALTAMAFQASALGRRAKLVVRNEPWRTFAITDLRIGGQGFGAHLVFENERLDMVALCLADPDGKLADEAIDAAHQRWLAANLRGENWRPRREPRRFPWGSLWAGLDVKSGSPEIVVAYGR
jgi:hypothetical protein